MAERIIPYREPKNELERTWLYFKHHGLVPTAKRISQKLTKSDPKVRAYRRYIRENAPSFDRLNRQKETFFVNQPLFSIVVPLYRTPTKYLNELLESVAAQTYSHWELILADASDDETLGSKVSTFARGRKLTDQIHYFHLPENLGIAGNTNAGIECCTGDFLVLVDHDDTISPDALFEMAYAINQDEEYDCLYSDEDTLVGDTGLCVNPHFKPDFSPNLLCRHNYITHLFVCRMSLARELGGERSEFDGAQDHDFILRATEKARKICHVPKVLYHWRAHEASTAQDMNSKTYAFDAGRRAVEEHYARCGVRATVEFDDHAGFYKPRFTLDNYVDCQEIIINDNKGGYKTAAQLNEEANAAKKPFIFFRDADLVPVSEDAKAILLGNMGIEKVGVATPRAFYGNNTISHAGLKIGLDNEASCPFFGLGREQAGYFFLARTTHEVLAVSLDAMMVEREVFETLGGFDEKYTPHAAAADFCIRLRKTGKRALYNAESQWYYLKKNNTRTIPYIQEDIDIMCNKWKYLGKRIDDPFFNENMFLGENNVNFRTGKGST